MKVMFGSTEQRFACLKIAAQMNRRMTKDDDIPTPATLIEYAKELEAYTQRGWRSDDKVRTIHEEENDGTLEKIIHDEA